MKRIREFYRPMQSTVTVADSLVKTWKDAIYAEEKQSPPMGFLESKGSATGIPIERPVV
jgi:hypothetical protein